MRRDWAKSFPISLPDWPDDLGHSFPTVSWAALGFQGPDSGAAFVGVVRPHFTALPPSNSFWLLYLLYTKVWHNVAFGREKSFYCFESHWSRTSLSMSPPTRNREREGPISQWCGASWLFIGLSLLNGIIHTMYRYSHFILWFFFFLIQGRK